MLLASRAISYALAVEGEMAVSTWTWSYATIHEVPAAHSFSLVVLGFLVVLVVVVVVVVDYCPCSNGRAGGVAGSERRRIPGGRPGQLAMGPLKRRFTKMGWGNAFGLHIVGKDRWRTQQYAKRVDHFWRRVQIRQLFWNLETDKHPRQNFNFRHPCWSIRLFKLHRIHARGM
jgi:hypothetical protein